MRSVSGVINGQGYKSVFAPVILVGFVGYSGANVVGAGLVVPAATAWPLPLNPNVGDTPRAQLVAAGKSKNVIGRHLEALSLPIADRFGPPVEITAARAVIVPTFGDTHSSAALSNVAGPESSKALAVRSDMAVFGLGTQPKLAIDAAVPSIDAALVASVVPDRLEYRPRADLLDGVPEEYARIIGDVARQEGVEANLILSIMHAENAGFDPVAVSPAGAIGLMQIRPATGKAFGANDLTDPAQNIRAGARFLKVLARKYRNPVLIAGAYHAGEPQVDIRRSLPLIRETADYVTKVVGLYSNAYISAGDAGTFKNNRFFSSAGKSTTVPPGVKTEKATRVSSPMLVYSASEEAMRDVEEVAKASSDPSGLVRNEKDGK